MAGLEYFDPNEHVGRSVKITVTGLHHTIDGFTITFMGGRKSKIIRSRTAGDRTQVQATPLGAIRHENLATDDADADDASPAARSYCRRHPRKPQQTPSCVRDA